MNSSADGESDNHASLIAQIADEFAERVANGENPDIDEYALRIPQAEPVIRDVLRSLQLMRDLKPKVKSIEGLDTGTVSIEGKIGDYEILGEIGRGGMGIVYKARQLSLGRLVELLKVLPLASSLDPIKIKRFFIETQSASMIQHPNVVTIFGTGCHQGVHYYAMQYIDGQSMDNYIAALRSQRKYANSTVPGVGTEWQTDPLRASTLVDRKHDDSERRSGNGTSSARPPTSVEFTDVRPIVPRMTFGQIAEVGRQCALALHAAHEFGIVHRDIKPSNLLIDRTGRVWITDFGLAHIESSGTLTRTGDVLGTVRYMSPEQAIVGAASVDRRSDVYSLGATLYELLTLEPMLQGTDRAALMRELTFDEPRGLRKGNPSIPVDLETVVLKAVAKEPHLRYASADELADDLTRFLNDLPVLARRPGIVHILTKLVKRHRTAAWTIAAVPAFGICGLVISNIEISRQRNLAEDALTIAQEKELLATSEARKAKTVSNVLQQLVGSANPDQSKGNNYTVRQLLDNWSAKLFDELQNQPEVEASLRSTIGNSYRRLGAPDKAQPHLQRALELVNASPRVDLLRKAECLSDMAWSECGLGRYADAEKLVRQAVELYEQTRERGQPALISLWCLQHCLMHQQKYADSDATAEKALKMAREASPPPPETANILHELAYSKNYQGDFVRSENYSRQSVELHSQLHGESHIETGWGLEALARALQSQEKYAEAEEASRRAAAIFEKNYSSDHKSVRMTQELLQKTLAKSGRTQEAADIGNLRFEDTIRPLLLSPVGQNPSLLQLLIDQKKFLVAGELILSAPDLFQDTEQCLVSIDTLIAYSELIVKRFGGDHDELSQANWLRTTCALLDRAADKCPNKPNTQNSVSWLLVSNADPRLHKPQRAIELALQATKANPDAGAIWNTLGLAYLRAGEYEQAIEAIEKSRQTPVSDEYDLTFLAIAHWHKGEPEKATEYLGTANTMYAKRKMKPNKELERFLSEANTLVFATDR